MQDHHGTKLKARIDRSSLKIKEISEKSGVPVSSMYDMYKKPELLRSKIAPILKALKIHPDDFFLNAEPDPFLVNDDGDSTEVKSSVSQLSQLIKKVIPLLEENNALLKKKK